MTLCIDAGASSAKWTRKTADGFASGVVGPITGHLFTDEAKAAAQTELTEIAAAAGEVNTVVLGITGVDRTTEVGSWLVEQTAQLFKVDRADVVLMNDMELAYSAVFAPGEGVLIYAGTGAIASQIDLAGNFVRAGGWGFHIGDFGGGYAIGAAALRYVTGLWDQGKEVFADEFAAAIMNFANCKNWPDLRIFIYSDGRSGIASLAPTVGSLADSGNLVAIGIIESAGKSLAELANHIINRTGASKVVAMGGSFKISTKLFAAMAAEISAPVEFVEEDIAKLWLLRNS